MAYPSGSIVAWNAIAIPPDGERLGLILTKLADTDATARRSRPSQMESCEATQANMQLIEDRQSALDELQRPSPPPRPNIIVPMPAV